MTKQAILYRMVMPGQGCPFGLKAKALLEREGCTVDDKWPATRGAIDAFKAENDVKTTPQTVIDGKRVGGYDARPSTSTSATSSAPASAAAARCRSARSR